MRYKLLFILVVCLPTLLNAQESLKDKLKRKLSEAQERTTDNTIDKILGKGENKVDEKVNDAIGGTGKRKIKKGNNTDEDNDSVSPASGNEKAGATVFSVNSKFDFLPGEKTVASEDFAQDAIGDFPAKWNTNASGEIVNLSYAGNKNWLQFGQRGIYYPEFVNELPENFTLVFDMATSDDISEMKSGLKVIFTAKPDRTLKYDQDFSNVAQAGVDIHPVNTGGSSALWVFNQNNEELLNNEIALNWKKNEANRISIWRQKTRLRIYVNETKVWDIPRAFMPAVTYSLLFATNLMEGKVFLADLNIAYGLPDTRNKLITEGKFSTSGILFDVNSDKIQPTSAGVLKEIATALNENPTVKIKIIGHTDADGSADNNLQLSKRRAEAVKTILTTAYGIAKERMQTDGKGASVPIESNQTPQGKANNRRVEFIKL